MTDLVNSKKSWSSNHTSKSCGFFTSTKRSSKRLQMSKQAYFRTAMIDWRSYWPQMCSRSVSGRRKTSHSYKGKFSMLSTPYLTNTLEIYLQRTRFQFHSFTIWAILLLNWENWQRKMRYLQRDFSRTTENGTFQRLRGNLKVLNWNQANNMTCVEWP